MWLIAGLGNPGPQYADTRHNIGWMLAAALREAWGAARPRQKLGALVSHAQFGSHEIYIAQPLTYMNNSGEPVGALLDYFDIKLENLLIICDDINLPFGKLRIRAKGSDGGHKGLRSIIAESGSEDFARLRLGIGNPPQDSDVVEWVLEPFIDDQWDEVASMLRIGIDVVETYLDQGIDESQALTNPSWCQSQNEGG